MSTILLFLTNILIKKEKSVTMILIEGGSQMEFVWLSFIPLLLLIYAGSQKKIKKLQRRIRSLEKKLKGETEMSRLIVELKGEKVKLVVNGSIKNYQILDVDEDWVKAVSLDKKQNTQLIRIEDIQGVQL